MPIYEYKCAACGQRIERLQRIDDPLPGPCEACGGAMHRQVSAPAFQFKGTGWYVTDYADRKGSAGKDGESKDGESKETAGKADSKDSATKDGSSKDVAAKDSSSKTEKSKAGGSAAKAETPASKPRKGKD